MVIAVYVLVTPSAKVNYVQNARLGAEHVRLQVPVLGFLVSNVRMAGTVNLMQLFVPNVLQDAANVHFQKTIHFQL